MDIALGAWGKEAQKHNEEQQLSKWQNERSVCKRG